MCFAYYTANTNKNTILNYTCNVINRVLIVDTGYSAEYIQVRLAQTCSYIMGTRDVLKNTHESTIFQKPFFVAGVTILLSLSVFSLMIADALPQTSEAIPLLGQLPFFSE